MAKRSNLIVVLGLAVFLVGAGATYLIAKDDGASTSASGPKVNVLYAAKNIPAGTSGQSALNQGLVRSKPIAVSAKPASALTDASQLGGLNAVLGVPEGSVLTSDQWQQAQTRIGTLQIPEGKTALALELSNVPGVAGFAGAGDKVNIYGLLKPDSGQSQAKLIMQNVEILNVNGSQLVTGAGTPNGTGLVFLLAVSPAEGEQLIYLTSFQQLYFALTAKDQAPVGGTPGVNAGQALKTL
ncbi:MAG: Flp pilus assembly protein CpaB [Acidimicrobiales bacterium]